MQQYLDLLNDIIENGETKGDRTGTGTVSIFGTQHKYDLRKGFPMVTTKKMPFKMIVAELLCFIKGSSSKKDFQDMNCPIWNEWCNPQRIPEGLSDEERKQFQLEEDDLGRIYGVQWTDWKGYQLNYDNVRDYEDITYYPADENDPTDKLGVYYEFSVNQLQIAIDRIKSNPDCRRIIVSAYNPAELDQMALPPCHMFFQLYVINGRLDCQMYQRSADSVLGVPFNIASYAVLMHMIAKECDLEAGIFTHTIGDAHIYQNHIENLKVQLDRDPLPLSKLVMADKGFWDYELEDFKLEGYESHEALKFPIAV